MAQYKGAASEAGRAMQIKKRREREQEEMEQKKRKLEETLKINKIENKFAVHYDAVEQQLKVSDHLKESTYVCTHHWLMTFSVYRGKNPTNITALCIPSELHDWSCDTE